MSDGNVDALRSSCRFERERLLGLPAVRLIPIHTAFDALIPANGPGAASLLTDSIDKSLRGGT